MVEGEDQKNENTVKCYGYYYQKDKEIAIVMELCDEHLGKMISRNEGTLTFDKIREILKQLNPVKIELYSILILKNFFIRFNLV